MTHGQVDLTRPAHSRQLLSSTPDEQTCKIPNCGESTQPSGIMILAVEIAQIPTNVLVQIGVTALKAGMEIVANILPLPTTRMIRVVAIPDSSLNKQEIAPASKFTKLLSKILRRKTMIFLLIWLATTTRKKKKLTWQKRRRWKMTTKKKLSLKLMQP